MTKKKIRQALKLIKAGKPKKLQKAREILEIELQGAIDAGEIEDEIAARHGLGRTLHYLGDHDTALQHFQTNVVKLESTPGFARISRANMARIFRNRGAWDRAIAILEELVVNARSAGHENRATAVKLEIGHILRDTGQLEESRDVYDWCLKRSKDSGDGQGVFDALISLATLDFFVGDYYDAKLALDKASDFAEAQSDSFRLIQVMKMRALIAERQGAFNEADGLYQQCIKKLAALHRRRGGFEEIFRGLKEILSRSNFNEAFSIYQDGQAQAFRQTIDDISFMAEIIQRRGEVQLAMRHSQEAIEILNQGLEIAERIWNIPRIASLLEALARAKLEGLPDEAESLVRRSLEISEHLNHPSESATAHRTIGRILRFRGEYSMAKKHLEKAVEIRRSLGYQLELCRDLQSLGEVFHETGAFRDAELAFEEGLLIGERLEAKYELALLLRSLGALFYERGILESSIAFLEEGKSYFEEMGIVDIDIFLALAKAHLDSQNRDHALWFFELGSAMAHERNDPHSIAACRLVAASIAASKGRLTSAEEIANVALQQSEAIQNFQLVVKSRLALANLALRKAQNSLRGDLEDSDPFAFFELVSKAGEYLDLSLSSAKQAGLSPVFTEVLIIKGILDLMLSRFDNAKEMANQASVAALEHGLYSHGVRANHLLEKIEDMRQKPVEMAEFFNHIEELLRPRRA